MTRTPRPSRGPAPGKGEPMTDDRFPIPGPGDPGYRERPARGNLPPMVYVQDHGRYTYTGTRGVAVYVVGRAMQWEPETYAATTCEACAGDGCEACAGWGIVPADDGDAPGSWWEADPDGAGEWIADPSGDLYAAMVGDGDPFPVDPDDLAPLDDGDYCAGCGQVGCGWGAA